MFKLCRYRAMGLLRAGRLALTFIAATLLFSCLQVAAVDRSEARFRKLLLGRHDNARLMAVESVAADFQSRIQALPILIDSLEKLRNDARFAKLEKQGLPDLPDGVFRMIQVIGTSDRPNATRALVELLGCERRSWSMAALNVLCENQHHAAIDAVADRMNSGDFDASYGYRFSLARGLKSMKHADAWEALSSLYERVDGQLAHRLREEFKRVTVEDLGDDEERFAKWRGSVGLSDEPEPSPLDDALANAMAIMNDETSPSTQSEDLPKQMSLRPSESAASYQRRHLKPSHYYGIEIYAKRLLFIIDRSGSMGTVVDGRTRIDRAKKELVEAIQGLDPQCEFGLLVFDSEIRTWRESLVPANESNKLDAVRFVEYLGTGSTTNTYGVLRRALSFDDQLEAVFMLTDGEPTSGRITNPGTILTDILRRNELHHLTINTIAIAVEPPMATFLRRLSEPSNGEYRDVK
ncbi:MAG: VWA domain-containing protein [Planctomycetota bacterium]